MAVVIKIPPALDKVLGSEASDALVDVFNQVDSAQRNGLERALDLRLQTLKEAIESRFDLTDEKIKLALREANQYTDRRIGELEARIDKRSTELEAKLDKRITEIAADMHVKLAQSQSSLIKWMFTFYIGSVVTITGLIIAYLQLFLKQ
jgi:hypothetical protein